MDRRWLRIAFIAGLAIAVTGVAMQGYRATAEANITIEDYNTRNIQDLRRVHGDDLTIHFEIVDYIGNQTTSGPGLPSGRWDVYLVYDGTFVDTFGLLSDQGTPRLGNWYTMTFSWDDATQDWTRRPIEAAIQPAWPVATASTGAILSVIAGGIALVLPPEVRERVIEVPAARGAPDGTDSPPGEVPHEAWDVAPRGDD